MFNYVVCVGRWTKDVELRYSQSGTAIANGRLASDDGFGERKKTLFLDVSIFGKQAEAVSQHGGNKGKLVLVSGKLEQREWEKDGQKRTAISVVADNVRFLPDGKGHQQAEPQGGGFDPAGDEPGF